MHFSGFCFRHYHEWIFDNGRFFTTHGLLRGVSGIDFRNCVDTTSFSTAKLGVGKRKPVFYKRISILPSFQVICWWDKWQDPEFHMHCPLEIPLWFSHFLVTCLQLVSAVLSGVTSTLLWGPVLWFAAVFIVKQAAQLLKFLRVCTQEPDCLVSEFSSSAHCLCEASQGSPPCLSCSHLQNGMR